MKIFIATLCIFSLVFSLLPLIFHFIAMSTYPGLIGVYFVKISPDNALYIGIIGVICLFLWYILEIKDEKKEKKGEKNQRFYDYYGSF